MVSEEEARNVANKIKENIQNYAALGMIPSEFAYGGGVTIKEPSQKEKKAVKLIESYEPYLMRKLNEISPKDLKEIEKHLQNAANAFLIDNTKKAQEEMNYAHRILLKLKV